MMRDFALPKIVSIGIYNAQVALKNGTVTQNRKTTMFEIELPLERGGISYIDDGEHAISHRTVICAKPGQIRHTRLPFKCYYIHMILGEGPLYTALSSLPNFIEFSDTEQIRIIFEALCEHYNTGAADDDILLQGLILQLIYRLKQGAPSVIVGHRPKANHHKVIEETLAYINKNPSADLALETLSGRANFSTVHFHKLFKASTGKTLHEYVEEQRIKQAIHLLLSTDMTLTQIAYECGFSSQSHFSYTFKKRMKMPPREYARSLHRKYEK